MRDDLPTGTVTFLFTDVEGSTRLLHSLGTEAYAEALAEHRSLIRAACAAEGGIEVDTQGDAFFFAFPTAPGALRAASTFTDALASGQVQVRVGLHTGAPLLTEEGYVGDDVHRAARIAGCGHGGQVLVSASTAPLVGTELTDLGQHRLKDLSAPELVYQLGSGEYPPLRTLHQTNLPVPQTRFLGRERELGEVTELLQRDDVRLLTLTGTGGTGKTRLAAQAAGGLAERYRDGVFWVPLAPLRDPELVLESAGQVLGAKDGLASHIGEKALLLLFDNFEHVVEAAPGLSVLLGQCPRLELLVTSRERLLLTAEHEYPVPALLHEEGVRFFHSRARAVKPDFDANGSVSEICRRLDDLPLALELAAARVKVLSPEQILSRLEQRLPLLTGGARDAPERQRTLRATIEWSHDLLGADEQALFAHLAVFAGGCSLEAAEEVCDADLDTLQSLVDKSLLRFSEERYWMLETIREYANEQLEARVESADVRRRQATYFRRLTEQAESELRGPTGADAFARIERELANIRAAIDWGSRNDARLALGLVSDLWVFWGSTGRALEGLRLADGAWTDDAPSGERLHALRAMSALALSHNDPEQVISLSETRLALARSSGDRRHESGALNNLGSATWMAGDRPAATKWLEQAIDVAATLDDFSMSSPPRLNLAAVEREQHNFARSRELLEEELALHREHGREMLLCWGLKELGMTATEEGAFDEARALFAEAFDIAGRIGTRQYDGILVFAVSVLESKTGQLRAAAVLAGAGEAMYEVAGTKILPSMVWFHALHDRLREELGVSDIETLSARGRAMEHDAAVRYARERLARPGDRNDETSG